MTESRAETSGPLAGIRVLELATVLAGPIAGSLLGDFGAEVIKVEDPGAGDPVRRYPPFKDGHPLGHKVINRNKQLIAVDLRVSDGQELVRELAARSDVVLTNYRLPTLGSWGLDYDQLAADRDDLVMLHLTGFGRTGPNREKPAFARTAEAYAGLTYISGSADGPPMFAGIAIGDALAGVYAAFGILLALADRSRTGRGQLVDLALYEPLLRIMTELVIGYSATGLVRERSGNANPAVAPSDIYSTSDGKWISVPSSTPKMYERLCQALGREDLVHDPRFKDNASRVEHREVLDGELRPAFATVPAKELVALLERHGVAATVVNSIADLYRDDHAWARGSLLETHDPELGISVGMPGVFPLLSGSPGSVRSLGGALGRDTRDVLSELLNISDEGLIALQKSGVIGCGIHEC